MFPIEQAVIVFLVAGIVAFCMVPVSKRIAHLLGAIDYPSNRRINTEPIPCCGGIALYCGFLAACLVIYVGCLFFGWGANDLFALQEIDYRILFVGVSLMFCVGLVDDIVQLSPSVKLLGQILAAAIVAASGVSIGAIRLLGNNYLELSWIDVPLTVLYLVIFVNIINLIDGLDGLAAGIVGISAIGLCILTTFRGSIVLALACVALIAVCLAFLRFNFYPASVFMGDSGALFLGLIIGIVSVVGIVRTQSFVVMLIPFVIAGVPVLDTLSSIVRRKHEHHPASQADLEHIHHRLVRFGLSQRAAVLILYACSAALVVCACLLIGLPVLVQAGVLLVLLIIALPVVYILGIAHPVLQHHYEGKEKRGSRTPSRAVSHAPSTSSHVSDTSSHVPNATADSSTNAAVSSKSAPGHRSHK